MRSMSLQSIKKTLRSPGESVLVVSRWDEKAGLRRDAVRSQVIDVLKAQIKRRPAMKKLSTATRQENGKVKRQKLTVGLDLGGIGRAGIACWTDPGL